jgi:NhaA family Na+:H+ antiporter
MLDGIGLHLINNNGKNKPMPIKFTQLFNDFTESEQASGVILILCTLIAIMLANSSLSPAYLAFWHTEIGITLGSFTLSHSLEHWVNDGLMAIFFLLIGLEIEREIYIGELSDLKSASLPIMAAIGGMLTPALFHYLLNQGTATQSGFGIPMATDIAFAIGVLMLLGNKVPLSLKIFLSALAIADDLGAIVVITLFYTQGFSLVYFLLAISVFAGLLILNRRGVTTLWLYLVSGAIMWFFMLQSGIHATITGVLLAFAIPFRNAGEDSPNHQQSPSYRLQHNLHKPVAFLIMPLFALANTGIAFNGNWADSLISANSLGISAGLVLGKPIGITLFSFLAVKLGLSQLPSDITWRHIVGAGCLGGIGFTMSTFITLLAFEQAELVQLSKIAILCSSLLAGILGVVILSWHSNKVGNTTP